MPQNDLFSMEKYATGFVEACAQLGVDPVELVKAAQALPSRRGQQAPAGGWAYQPEVQEQFRYGDELAQARRREMDKGSPARAGMFARREFGLGRLGGGPFAFFNPSGTSDVQVPMVRAVAGIAGSKPVQFVKGLFGGGDDRRAAPAPAPSVDPDRERYKREAQIPQGGGTIFDRMRHAEERHGAKYDSRLMGNMGKPWYQNVPPPPPGISRPAPVESLVTPAGR
jgi:hypothetical protein